MKNKRNLNREKETLEHIIETGCFPRDDSDDRNYAPITTITVIGKNRFAPMNSSRDEIDSTTYFSTEAERMNFNVVRYIVQLIAEYEEQDLTIILKRR